MILRLHLKILALILFPLAAIAALNILTAAGPSLEQRLFASLIVAFGFIPTFLYVAKNDPGIPFLPFFGIVYIIYYAVPVFTLADFSLPLLGKVDPRCINAALAFAAIGIFMLVLSYYMMPVKQIGRFIPRVGVSWDPRKACFWAVGLGSLGLFFSYLRLIVRVPVQFDQIGLFFSELSVIGVGILFILQLERRLGTLGKMLLWLIFLPLLILIRLGTSATAQIYSIIIFLSFLYWYFCRRIPWLWVALALILFVVFSSFKAEYRKLTVEGQAYSQKTPIEKSIIFARMPFGNREVFRKGYEVAAIRTSHCLLSFAHVIKLTPTKIPYWNGKSYSVLLWAPIPRVIFPWKPQMKMGQDFGHRYEFLNPADHTTSYSLPQLVEMYINFGIPGILIGMFIIGLIYRFIYEMFSHPRSGEGGVLIGAFIFTRLLIIESDFSIVFGNIVYYIILLMFVNKLMQTKRPKVCGNDKG